MIPAEVAQEVLDELHLLITAPVGGWVAIGEQGDKVRLLHMTMTPRSTKDVLVFDSPVHRAHYVSNLDLAGPYIGDDHLDVFDDFLESGQAPAGIEALRDHIAGAGLDVDVDDETVQETVGQPDADTIEARIVSEPDSGRVVVECGSEDLRKAVLMVVDRFLRRMANDG